MGTSLTREQQLVLQHLVSGKNTEEIAATLDLPLQAVRTCTHTLITLVLDQREASTTLPAPPGSQEPAPHPHVERLSSLPFAGPPATGRTLDPRRKGSQPSRPSRQRRAPGALSIR
jgi:hypothetical protein